MDKKPQSSLQSDLSVFDKIAAGKAAAVPFRPALARFSGVLLGALAGLAYASTWRSVNHLVLPNIPLGWSLPNLLAGALPFVLSGGLIGAACIWPQSTVVGALLAGGLLLAALVGAFMTSEPAPLSPLMPNSPNIYTFLAIVLVLVAGVPYFLLLRRAAQVQGERWNRPWWSWERLRLPLLALALASVVGLTALYPPRVRRDLVRMEAIIERGRWASSAAELPEPLQDAVRVPDFTAHARRPYVLSYSRDERLRSDLASVLAPLDVAIVAHFADGWRLACLFKDGHPLVLCRSYTP